MVENASKATFSDDSDERPQGRDAYSAWLDESFGVKIDSRLEARYEAVVGKVQRDFEASEFWTGVCAALNDFDGSYRLGAQNYPLFLDGGRPPSVIAKSFDSYLLKTYRRNVAENERWPEPPVGEWVFPDQAFSQQTDLVRTSFVVKYLDGVEFLAERLKEGSSQCGCSCTVDFEARMEGHYAAHLSVRDEFAVPGPKWDTETMSFSVEIQIITQLQEAIRKLTHKYYEARRSQPVKARSNWQWNYRTDEFTANYLGHILHYVEGMIMDVRSRQKDDPKGAKTW